MQKKIIIIGAGLAGLSAACLAIKRGYKVVLFEAADGPGGDSRAITMEGFTFDQNPKLYPAPYLMDTLLPGKSNSVSSQFKQAIPAVQVTFADRKKMLFLSENELTHQMEKEVSLPLLQGEASYQKLETILMEAMNQYTGKKLPFWQHFIKRSGVNLNLPLLPAIGQISSDPYMQQTLMLIAASMGTTIESLRLSDLFLPAIISRSGLFHPRGGMQSIIDLLSSYLQQSGAKIFTRLPVIEILPVQHNTIGIRLADEQQEWGDYILNTTQILAPENSHYTGTQPMLLYHFGVDASEIPSLGYFNIVILNHVMKSWQNKQTIDYRWKPAYFYINQPTRYDASLAPEGMSLLNIKIPLSVDTLSYQDKEFVRETVLSILEDRFYAGFRKKIRMETSFWLSKDEKASQKIPTLSSSSQPGFAIPFANDHQRLTHLNQYYQNRQPGIPQILFAVQRWLENLEKLS